MRSSLLLNLILFAAVGAVWGQNGTIKGKLTYPGEGIPTDLALCVKFQNAASSPVYCSSDSKTRLSIAGVAFSLNRRGAAYSVSVPAGSYYIYAKTAEMPGVKAYYDEFVRCGMSVNCKSKKPILIKVRAGGIVSNVTVGDFW